MKFLCKIGLINHDMHIDNRIVRGFAIATFHVCRRCKFELLYDIALIPPHSVLHEVVRQAAQQEVWH